jgi:LTXXQ motif family protein
MGPHAPAALTWVNPYITKQKSLRSDGSDWGVAFPPPTTARSCPSLLAHNQEKLMSKVSKALAIVLFVATVPATIVLAQQDDAKNEAAVEKSEKRRGPSPEVMSRLEDGRIAMAKEALKLTPEQAKLWAPVEEKIRANFAEKREHREEWREKRKERREARKNKDGERPSLPERLEKRSERMEKRATRMTERAAKTKQFAEVMKPFYASLTEEQKEVADHVLRRVAGDKMGRGHHGHHGKRKCGRGGHGRHGGGWH